jgi:hypothetical protein
MLLKVALNTIKGYWVLTTAENAISKFVHVRHNTSGVNWICALVVLVKLFEVPQYIHIRLKVEYIAGLNGKVIFFISLSLG